MIVMKFGGSSIGDAKCIQRVAKLIATIQAEQQVVVVVSAMSKVTDLLMKSAQAAAHSNRQELDRTIKQIRNHHQAAIKKLALRDSQTLALDDVCHDKFAELEQLLNSIFILGELTPRALDTIVSYGERLSIQLVAQALESVGIQAEPLEANNFIVTDDQFGEAQPLLQASVQPIKKALLPLLKQSVLPVVTGFIGATEDGILTTLGRGGSDYSATILGNCLDADEVWIWTDVDGVMTADPQVVKGAHTIPALSYSEAAELSYFGAKVLHPLTMVPASLKQIPILIKNTFRPDGTGTKISGTTTTNSHPSKAISTISGLCLVTVQGKGMIGVPGVAAKVFGAIASAKINVLFISQASSEYNISFVVRQADGGRAVRLLQETFVVELAAKTMEMIKLDQNLAIVALVGEGMHGHPGMAGKLFSSLGDSDINITAIAQGSSELNISLVIHEFDLSTAVNSIHRKFHMVQP